MIALRRLAAAALVGLALAPAAAAQDPAGAQWIWGSWAPALNERPRGEKCWFRRELELAAAPKSATLFATCDNHFVLWVNGARAGRGDSWQEAAKIEVAKYLRPGKNVLTIEATNDGGPAALLLFGDVVLDGGKTIRIASDPSFRTSPKEAKDWSASGFDAKDWKPAASYGPLGSGPWQNVVFAVEERFAAPPGFRVETAAEGIGSLVALALGDRGEIFVSVEGGPILRLRDVDGDGRFEEALSFCGEVTGSHGLCWSGGSLFATGIGPRGAGLYRITPHGGANAGSSAGSDAGSDAKEIVCLGTFTGEGAEHGAHGVVAGPDGRLYLAVGNHHQIAQPWSADSPYKLHYEGSLLPTYGDPLGHAVGIRAPGGTVVSVDRDGKDWRVFAAGFRNHYDVAFDASGELFTVDSDMEWDVGLPWYRPVGVYHVIPGGEYGWRTGSGVWPPWYADALPAAAEIGRGSPTGTTFYLGKSFPPPWRGALLCGDWSQGRILAIRLAPRDATYTGTVDVLLSGHPLNITDLEVEPSGSLLFTTGGRGTHGAVHRLVYEGPAAGSNGAPAARRVPFDWLFTKGDPLKALSSNDRFTRFAAARALERRGVTALRPAFDAEDLRSGADATVAMARLLRANPDPRVWLDAFFIAISTVRGGAVGEARLSSLRALELLLLDPNAPSDPDVAKAKKTLLTLFPTNDRAADRELAILLAYCAPEGAIEKLLAQMEGESSRAEGIHMAYCLRCIREGWTADQRIRWLRWVRAHEKGAGGASYSGYLEDIANELKPLFTKAEWAEAGKIVGDTGPPTAAIALPGGNPKDFDKTLAFLRGARRSPERSAAEGALVYRALCAQCHRFGDEGGRTGPDLTTVANRFSLDDLLDATLRPSRVISSQYQSTIVWRKSGEVVVGAKGADDAKHVVIALPTGERVDIPRADVDEERPSPLSAMPDGLLDSLTYEQTADLFAFLDAPPGSVALGNAALGSMAPAESAWRPLFDGKSLEGWDGDADCWHVEDGAIVGRAKGLPGSRFLVSKEKFRDFAVEFDVKLEEGNSGLQFRATQPQPRVLLGYQADIGQSYWGSLYEEGGRGMLAQVANEIWTTAVDRKGFNHYLVSAVGDRLRIELNGVTTVDLRDDRAREGYLGFQLHAGIENRVTFRNLRIRQK